MPVLERKEKMVQVIHCASHHHWIVATTIRSGGNSVVVHDSASDRETVTVTFATALAHGQNPSKQRFHQQSLRYKFVACLVQGELTPFP